MQAIRVFAHQHCESQCCCYIPVFITSTWVPLWQTLLLVPQLAHCQLCSDWCKSLTHVSQNANYGGVRPFAGTCCPVVAVFFIITGFLVLNDRHFIFLLMGFLSDLHLFLFSKLWDKNEMYVAWNFNNSIYTSCISHIWMLWVILKHTILYMFRIY